MSPISLRTAKSANELVLDGVDVQPEYHNKSLRAITLTDGTGRVLKIEVEYSTLKALVVAEPETKEVFVLRGKVPVVGADINEAFESEYDAQVRRRELEQASVIENAEIAVGTVEVPL